jgi:exonuclease SbcC
LNPLSIEMTNFRAIEYALIDLTEVTLAAICGPNGAGKSSSFTLAPIFSLFGDKIKGLAMDDLVRKGAQEMAVSFKFEHQGKIYRTTRTRSTKGSGKSTLELQEWIADKWESRSAEKIKDTEDGIRNLLNLDAETFTASSMILQGKANEFTAQTAGKRKEILQQILGLSIYDQLQDEARKSAAVLHMEIEKAKDKLADYDVRLEFRPAKMADLAFAEQSITAKQLSITIHEQLAETSGQNVARLEAIQPRVADMQRDLTQVKTDIDRLEAEHTTFLNSRERQQKILSNELAIIDKCAEFDSNRDKIITLEARLPEKERLSSRYQSVTQTIALKETESLGLIQRVNDLQTLLSSSELIRQQAEEYPILTAQLNAEQVKADLWNELEQPLNAKKAELIEAQTRIQIKEQSLQSEIQNLEAKTKMLDNSNCIDVTIAACSFLSDAQDAKQLLVAKTAELAEINRKAPETISVEVTRLTDERLAIGYDANAHRALKSRVDTLRPIAEQASQLESRQELLQTLLTQRDGQASEIEKAKLESATIMTEIDELELALTPLALMKETQTKLQVWVNLKDELAAAKEGITHINDRIDANRRDVDALAVRKSTLDTEIAVLSLQLLELDVAREQLAVARRTLQTLRAEQTQLVSNIGALKAQLEGLDAAALERDLLRTSIEPKALEWSRYQTLIRAFGKDGIPALIIENAVPELERIANEILSQMSKGRHYVRFETQKELKSRDGIAETLDIIIGDWTAERPYETFSGGEQLRIDYAIRFALAELLARRAGSKVEWLTIDEGLGSQDAEHRGLVLESIKSVADRFKKVLVITHIEDAQAVFDQRIMFSRTEHGVEVNVA